MKTRLRRLALKLRERQEEYQAAVLQEANRNLPDRYAANRYEGIAMASRWAAEDLEKLIEEEQDSYDKPS
jgi:hypothetical protein